MLLFWREVATCWGPPHCGSLQTGTVPSKRNVHKSEPDPCRAIHPVCQFRLTSLMLGMPSSAGASCRLTVQCSVATPHHCMVMVVVCPFSRYVHLLIRTKGRIKGSRGWGRYCRQRPNQPSAFPT